MRSRQASLLRTSDSIHSYLDVHVVISSKRNDTLLTTDAAAFTQCALRNVASEPTTFRFPPTEASDATILSSVVLLSNFGIFLCF